MNEPAWRQVIEEGVTRVEVAVDVVRGISVAGLEMRWQMRVSSIF